DLRHVVPGGEELLALRRVDAVEAGMRCRRAGDTHVDLLRAGAAHHLDDLLRCRAADDAVVHQDHPTAPDVGPVGVVLEPYAEMADVVRGLDEGPANIVVADDAELERNARLCRVAKG